MMRHRERDRDRDRNGETLRGDRPTNARGERRPDEQPSANGSKDNGRGGVGGSARMSGTKAVRRAQAHLAELTGSVAEGLSSLTRTRDGWRAVLEIVELERIPRTTDIMASYAIDLDSHGELIGYQRIARYYRSDVSGEQ